MRESVRASQVYRVSRWRAERERWSRLWRQLPTVHRGVIAAMIAAAFGVPMVMPWIAVQVTDGLLGARGLGVALRGIELSIGACMGVALSAGTASLYVSIFDGEARQLMNRMIWRAAMGGVCAWMMLHGWLIEGLLFVVLLFVQSSFMQRGVVSATLVLQYCILMIIVRNGVDAAAARAMTIGEATSIVWWLMIATFFVTKNQHVINNLIRKK